MNKLDYRQLQIKGNGRVIYVAGAYRNKTEEGKWDNIWHATRVACRLWELGWAVICPHCNTANFEFYFDVSSDRIIEGYLEILKRCDAIFMLSNWDCSAGSKLELEVAKENGLDIYYEDSR